MMIAHLFNKVYLSFDFMFQPVYDTLSVSERKNAPHASFINRHIGMGRHHGSFADINEVNWSTFFTSVANERTVIYADAVNFAAIYFSFLRTIKPYIKKSAAIKILEIVLKRTEFVADTWTETQPGIATVKKNNTLETVEKIRNCVNQAWAQSKTMNLTPEFVRQGMGIEFLLAQYWADGRHEEMLKTRLESMWWKSFVFVGEELKIWHMIDWMYKNPGSNKDQMLASVYMDSELSWLADPNLSESNVEQFKQNNNWSTVIKIFNYAVQCRQNRMMLEMIAQWKNVVDKNWGVILNQSDPLSLLAVFSEPSYSELVNGWLVSYFAAQPQSVLREMVI